MKEAFRVIVSSFQALLDSIDKSYCKRLRILGSMFNVNSYVEVLDPEYDALVLDIFHQLLASIQDDLSPLLLAHIESILEGIL